MGRGRRAGEKKTVSGRTRRSAPALDPGVEDQIIDATVRCFQRFGVAKTAMEDIAKTAKLSRPTLYRYFPSRHHLVVNVLVREIRDHTRVIAPLFRQHPHPPTALGEAILLAVATARQHPYTGIVTSDAGADLFQRVPGSDQVLQDAMSEQWLPALNRWQEQGYLRRGLRLNDVLLWLTIFMYTALSRAEFMGLNEERMRRLIDTLLVPAVFDPEAIAKDFPNPA